MKIILSAILVFLFFQTQAQDELTTTRVRTGQKVPDFSFSDENGKTMSISDYRGKVVMITFFATWCGPCREELPHIQKEIYNRYKDNPNFRLLIFGREHSSDEMNNFKKTQGFTMPFFADKSRSVYSLFAEKYIPRNFLVEADGKIVFSETGFNDEKFSELKKRIEEYLAK